MKRIKSSMLENRKQINSYKYNRKSPSFRKLTLAIFAFSAIMYAFVTGSATYPPDQSALLAMQSTETTIVVETKSYISFSPAGSQSSQGFLIYPHDNIDPQAYAPLAKAMQERFNTTLIILKYPFKYQWLGIYQPRQITMSFDDISSWNLIMHGNGGLLSNLLVPTNTNVLIYLSSYPLIKRDEIQDVMVLRGTLDEINDETQWLKQRKKFPVQSIFYELDKANFSHFANFGILPADSAGLITPLEQQQALLDYVEDFIEGL